MSAETTMPTAFVCPLDHLHADATTCYQTHGCRCDPCRVTRWRARKAVQKLKREGRYSDLRVDAAPARQHILTLLEQGMSTTAVAAGAGTSTNTIRHIAWTHSGPGRGGQPTRRVSAMTARRILALRPDLALMPARALIPATGMRRRVEALVARGWTMLHICREANLTQNVVAPDHGRVMVSTHLAIAEVYDRLWNVEPPQSTRYQRQVASRSRGLAAANGWLPPLAWDDIDYDPEPPAVDPEDTVDEIAVALAVAGEKVGRLTQAERHEALRTLNGAFKLSDAQIAVRLGVEPRTVLRDRDALGIPAAVGFDGEVIAS